MFNKAILISLFPLATAYTGISVSGTVKDSIRRTAVKTAESYEGRAPTKTDIFTEGNAGKVISFKCWIGLSVTVPAL